MEFSSRMKDYYDIYYIANKFDFDGEVLTEALRKTFSNREHSFTLEQFDQADIVVAFHIFPPLVLPIAEICPHTGNGKILPAAVQRGQPVVLAGDKPAGFIKDGLHGKLVMLKKQVLFGGSVVGIFRVDMLECCQPRHLLSVGLHT